MFIPFIKMHGAGNDFVVIDNRKTAYPISELHYPKLADRQFGIGCDQIVVLAASNNADCLMHIINADGSEVASCGNASRCVAWLLFAEKENGSSIVIETKTRNVSAHVTNENCITVDMGEPFLQWDKIPLSQAVDTLHLPIEIGDIKDAVAVNMGNPHAVFFAHEPYSIDLSDIGRRLETHPLFPERANISFVRIESKNHITQRVWERGAGATLACGTAACAALVAAHQRGLTGRKAQVDLPGGTLIIEWRESDNHVLMTGPVATSFVGTFDSRSYINDK